MKRILTILMTVLLLCSPIPERAVTAEDEVDLDDSYQAAEVLTEELEEEEEAVVETEETVTEELEEVEEMTVETEETTVEEKEELPVAEESTDDLFVVEEDASNFLKHGEINFQEKKSESSETRNDTDGFQTPPLTFHGGYLDTEPLKHDVSSYPDAEINVTIPTSYDLRNYNLVTGVRDQNPYGTCWSFATMASAESGILKKYGRTVDLSELQLAYYGWNSYGKADPLGLITNDGSKYTTTDPYETMLDAGGYDITADLALASGIGFSEESVYPYSSASTYLKGNGSKPCYNTKYRLKSSKWLSMSEKNVIKTYLMNYGALAVSYYHDDDYFNESKGAYYQNSETGTNHAVTLVGWNDNYSKSNFKNTPSGNGAWLIKNSWGTGWGNGGYFWISYYDTSIKDGLAIFYEAEIDNTFDANNYHIYQYDGSVNEWEYWYGDCDIYVSNVYKTVNSQELLKEVGFFFYGADTDYTIYVYKNVSSTPDTGTLALTQNGHQKDAGYQIITLNKEISLSKGEKYAVVVKQKYSKNTIYAYTDLTDSWTVQWQYYGSSTTYSGTYQLTNTTSNDISYISDNGSEWTSLTSYGESARIKAITVNPDTSRKYIRIYHQSRLEESIKVANELKSVLGVSKFSNIIIAKDSDFADALSGSYLASRKSAPILLVGSSGFSSAYTYINNNLVSGGTVYILGSSSAVPSSFEAGLSSSIKVKRLEGTSRYLTNLEILKEAGVTASGDIIIVTGSGYADSLSAGSTGLPIMMVASSLKNTQKNFLKEYVTGKIYILGQEASVSADVEKALKSYGKVTRIGGDSRWITTRLVAQQFFAHPKYVVLATGNDFADGLIASPLAYALNAPLLMCASNKTNESKTYVANKGVIKAYIVGSKDYIDDAGARKILGIDESVTITEK